MKVNVNKVLINISIALCLLFFIGGNALAASDSHEDADSFLQKQVDKMDPAVQPYAQIVADNIVAFFVFCGGVFILIDTVMASYKKKQGKTNEAAGYKHSQWDSFVMLILGIVMFGIFAAVVQSSVIGLQ